MKLTLQQLKTLAPTGEPLHITLSRPSGQSPQIKAQGRRTLELPLYQDLSLIKRQLTKALKYYPDPVTIDSKPIERFQFPDLARVKLTMYPDHNVISSESREIRINPSAAPPDHPFNLFAAGILCQLDTSPIAQETAYTPVTGPHRHWQYANTVTITAVPALTHEQLINMTQSEWDTLNDTKGLTPLKVELMEKAHLQIRRTKQAETMPHLHQGPVYAYLLANFPAPAYFSRGAPVIVHRTPVIFSGPELPPDPAIISAAETLYTTDQDLVPVAATSIHGRTPVPKVLKAGRGLNTPPHRTITAATLTEPQEPDEEGKPPIREVDNLTMELALGDTGEPVIMPAVLWCAGKSVNDRTILHTGEKLSIDRVADIILRAYWTDDHQPSTEEDEWDLEQAEYNAMFTAQAILGDPDQAYVLQLKRHINIFQTDIPFPSKPMTFVTNSGTITVSLQPDKTT